MTGAVARVIFPLALMAAFALWARGYAEAGDGFSAGVVAGAAAALLYVTLSYERARRRAGAAWATWFLVGGLMLALAVALAPLALGLAPVTHYPPPRAEVTTLGVLELHTAALFDLGIGLAVYGAVVSTLDRLFPTFWSDME